MTIDTKFDFVSSVNLRGSTSARDERMRTDDRDLSNSDLFGKYLDIAKACDKQGKYKDGARFRKLAYDAREGYRR